VALEHVVITYKVRREVFVLDPPLSESRGYHFCLLESGTMGEVTCDVVERS
jgi:hypothetical protein